MAPSVVGDSSVSLVGLLSREASKEVSRSCRVWKCLVVCFSGGSWSSSSGMYCWMLVFGSPVFPAGGCGEQGFWSDMLLLSSRPCYRRLLLYQLCHCHNQEVNTNERSRMEAIHFDIMTDTDFNLH